MDDDDRDPSDPLDSPSPHRFASLAPAGRPAELEVSALLARSGAPLKALFRSHGITPDESEDILQGALLVMVQLWPAIEFPLPFFVGTVRHRIQAYLQRQRTEREALAELARREASAAGDVPQRLVDCREDARRLLARLPEESRPIVALRYGAELPSREVAHRLDRPETAVRQAASRGLRRLRRHVEAIRSRH
jgi:RNA polymerase sigma factor (sigma-70 family)